MIRRTDTFEIDDDVSRIDFETVQLWLSSTYWSPGVPRDVVERAAAHSSLVIGAYSEGEQIGYLRVVSDKTTFAWVCDVFVSERFRGRSVARSMVAFALDHPEHQNLRRWLLATKDAHSVYAAAGFTALPEPGRWMIHLPAKG